MYSVVGKDILGNVKKVLLYILSGFSPNSAFVSESLKNGPSER
jgi:hypothetical protein